MPITRKQLGSIMKQAREARGLSLRQAAEKLGIHFAYYDKIERGENPLGKHAKAVAKLLGLDSAEVEAMALATRSEKLPNFAPYLRAKYQLNDVAIAELEAHFKTVSKQRKSTRGQP